MAIGKDPVIPDSAKGYDPRADTGSPLWVPAELRTRPMDVINLPILQPPAGAEIDATALEEKLAAEWKAAHSDEL